MEDMNKGKKWYQGFDLKTMGYAALGSFIAVSIMNYGIRNARYAEIERHLEKARTGIENFISERKDIIDQLLEKRPELADRIKFDEELGTYTFIPDSGIERKVYDGPTQIPIPSKNQNFVNNADIVDRYEFRDGKIYLIDPNLGRGSTLGNPVPIDNPIVHGFGESKDGKEVF